MSSKVAVIVNSGSGSVSGGQTVDELKRLFTERGIEADIVTATDSDGLQSLSETAARGDAEVVVAGGGDGTISSVASALAGTEKTLGILPLGTLNNFSKDLQIPQDPSSAVGIIADGFTQKIDIAEVNGRRFINNSSIGLYPRIVRKREHQQRLGHGKWSAAAWAAWRFLWISPFLRVRLMIEGRELFRKTPFVFVGNNDYEMDFYNIGRRSRIDGGNLSIYLLHRSGRRGLFFLVLRTIFGRLRQASDFEAIEATELRVLTRRKGILVACDGEVTVMTSPLEYRIHPQSLRVIVPRPETI
jgi:diacylglycerol kinase family enzyme